MIALAFVLLGFLPAALIWHGGRHRRARLRTALAQATAGQAAVQRIARLASIDLRDAALRLHGHVGTSRAADPESCASLAALAERCRMLADDLGAAGLAPDLPALSEERIDLLACAREAASALAAAMAPGRRHFRLPPAGDAAHVWADRRAVRQVLGRVLAEAALNTGDGDCISVSLSEATNRVELVVADEGNGLGAAAAADEPALVPRDSRGIGAPLALARVLMEAHEGRLDVVAAAGAGTKVSLVFPPSRRRSGAPACDSRNTAIPS